MLRQSGILGGVLALAVVSVAAPSDAAPRAGVSDLSVRQSVAGDDLNMSWSHTRKEDLRTKLGKKRCKKYGEESGGAVLKHCRQRVLWTGKAIFFKKTRPLCVRFRYTAHFRWNIVVSPHGWGADWWKLRLAKPRARYAGYTYYSCTSPAENIRKKVGYVRVRSTVNGGGGDWSCDLNPSFSVITPPFRVMVSILPECGSEKGRQSRWKAALNPPGARKRFDFLRRGRFLRVEPWKEQKQYQQRVCFTLRLHTKIANAAETKHREFRRRTKACPDPTPPIKPPR